MKGKSLLENIKLDMPDTDPLKKAELREKQYQIWDESVIDYVRIRGADKDFREKIKAELSEFKSRRGPKPEGGLSPRPFFHLIQTIKRVYGLSSIDKALEEYCEIHGLPLEKASSLKDKYKTGKKENLEKGGVV